MKCENCKNDIEKDISAKLPYCMVGHGPFIYYGCYRCFPNAMELINYVRNKKKI